jgi:hypothetical protein
MSLCTVSSAGAGAGAGSGSAAAPKKRELPKKAADFLCFSRTLFLGPFSTHAHGPMPCLHVQTKTGKQSAAKKQEAAELKRVLKQVKDFIEQEVAFNSHFVAELRSFLQGGDKDAETKLVQAALTKAGYFAREDFVRENGDCMFDSLADQLYSETDRKTWGSAKHRKSKSRYVRDLIADQILGKEGSDRPGPMASLKDAMLEEEIEDLRIETGWGCHPVLVAAATLFKRNIRVYGSRGMISISPLSSSAREAADTKPPLLLCHWFERHFGSLAPLAHTQAGGGAGGAGSGGARGGAGENGDTVMKQL